MKRKIRLSYLRIVIIAAVIGLVAKMTGPQSSQANINNNTSKLIEALIEVRSGLDQYRAEHNGQMPPTSSSVSFESALMQSSEVGYGPYVKGIPDNPFNGLDTVRFDGEAAGANTAGWRLDTETGVIQADNDSAYSAL